jgi:hypothetical protein
MSGSHRCSALFTDSTSIINSNTSTFLHLVATHIVGVVDSAIVDIGILLMNSDPLCIVPGVPLEECRDVIELASVGASECIDSLARSQSLAISPNGRFEVQSHQEHAKSESSCFQLTQVISDSMVDPFDKFHPKQ